MTINLFDKGGCPLERQRFTWKELVGKPISKLDDDAFSRVRIVLMNGVEHDALRMKQVMLRMNRNARVALAELMRLVELASAAGHQELADDFGQALKQENEHRSLVRGWLWAAVLQEAT